MTFTHINKIALVTFLLLPTKGNAEIPLLKDFPFFEKTKKFFSPYKEEEVTLKQKIDADCLITLSNNTGPIEIKTWKEKEVLVKAHKKGSLDEINNTLIKKIVGTNSLIIQTAALKKGRTCSVHYTVFIPETSILQSVQTVEGKISVAHTCHGVNAKTDQGSIDLHNVSGAIKTSCTKGSINITSDSLSTEDSILAITGKGTVTVAIPQGICANVHLKTNKGKINSSHPITLEPVTMKFDKVALTEFKKEVKGKTGTGGASIKIHSCSGNINFVQS